MDRRIIREQLQIFWENHYNIIQRGGDVSQFVSPESALSRYKSKHPRNGNIDLQKFTRESANLQIGIKLIRGRQGAQKFNVTLKHPSTSKVNLYLWNGRGLITINGNNRSQFLADFINPSSNNIVALTETHLTPNHLDEEILTYFKNYSIQRTDRDTEVGRKTRGGGVALLTSEHLVCITTDYYSNGCC